MGWVGRIAWRQRTVVLVLALLAIGRAGSDEPPKPDANPAPAKPAPRTVEQAADAVLAAWKSKDEAALKALAEKDDPDPWLVADDLLARAEADAADAFARTSPRLGTEMLQAYVVSRRGATEDPARRTRLAKGNAALADDEPQKALDALGPLKSPVPAEVVEIRLAVCRGLALIHLVRLQEAQDVLLPAAEAAERIGWLPRAPGEGDGLLAVNMSHRLSAARTLANSGNAHYAQGRFTEALSIYERALAAQEALGDKRGAAWTLASVGNVHVVLGDATRALAILRRALGAQEALGDKAAAAQTLNSLGVAHFRLGNFSMALAAHEEALAVFGALRDQAGVAGTLDRIGGLHDSLGDFAKALTTLERAFAIWEALGDKAGAAYTLGIIGNVRQALGDYVGALSTLERAREAKEAHGNKMGAAWTRGNIGNVHYFLGDYAKALSDYEHAHATLAAMGDRPGAAWTLGNIGNLHHRLGDYAKALSAYERVLRAAIDMESRETFVVATIGLAAAHLERGEVQEAARQARQAVGRMADLASGLGEEQGAGAREQYASAYGIGARSAAALSDEASISFFLESGRAGSLLESLKGRDAMRRTALPESLRLAEAHVRAKEAAAVAAYRRALESGDLVDVRMRREEVTAAQETVREVVARIQRESKSAANVLCFEPDSLEAIQSRIKAGEALVMYGLIEKESLALVLTADEARIVRLLEAKAIEAACAPLVGVQETAEADSAVAALRRVVIEPLALGADVKRVLVSPDGALAYVPFSVLIMDREIVYEPSGTTYGLLLQEKDLRGDGVLALGDADYGTTREPHAPEIYSRSGGFGLTALPGSREEAESIGDKVILAKSATEAGFAAAVSKRPRWRGVHFACHGLVDVERPMLSSLALTPDAWNDGFFTALEVFRSKIPADLVVLSACETGRGKVVRGEGIMGLTRAFMFAGAPRVICSLWKVDDEATLALMKEFYRLWNPKDGTPGMGTAAALKAAQEFVRTFEKDVPDADATKREGRPVTKKVRPWEHPHYWAAWVLWGLAT